MTPGLTLLLGTLLLRSVSVNRHVRGRLTGSAMILAVYVAVAASIRYLGLSPEFVRQLQLVQPLLLALAVINAVVALAVNPWRADRLPDHFPKIVQDAIVIALFAVAAVVVLQERVFATTAAAAVVIGFALQETLGNLFAGLAIQVEKPFRVGHWVRVAGNDGLVSEITWRATKIRTKSGNFVVVANSMLSRDPIVNYSEPSPETRVEVEIGASYDIAPNQVKAVILAAIRHEPLLSPSREPEVLIADFAPSSITYRIRVWTSDFAADEHLRDRVRSAVYYAFRRNAIEIPYPTQVEIQREPASRIDEGESSAAEILKSVEIFSSLDKPAVHELGRAARRSLYGAGEIIVRQGDPGASMFVVVRGEAVVSLEPSGEEVARVKRGGFFGEMSLLTGAARTATVRAAVDSEFLEITVETFRQFVLANPAAVEHVGVAVSTRAIELAQRRAAGTAAAPEPPATFLDRVRRFLHLSST